MFTLSMPCSMRNGNENRYIYIWRRTTMAKTVEYSKLTWIFYIIHFSGGFIIHVFQHTDTAICESYDSATCASIHPHFFRFCTFANNTTNKRNNRIKFNVDEQTNNRFNCIYCISAYWRMQNRFVEISTCGMDDGDRRWPRVLFVPSKALYITICACVSSTQHMFWTATVFAHMRRMYYNCTSTYTKFQWQRLNLLIFICMTKTNQTQNFERKTKKLVVCYRNYHAQYYWRERFCLISRLIWIASELQESFAIMELKGNCV